MESLAMKFLADEIYSNQDQADLFSSKEEVEILSRIDFG